MTDTHDLPLLARGREADVYALDDERVLRRFRDPGRTGTELEVEVMAYAAVHGYPVPHVYDATGTDLILERLHGPTLMQAWQRRPWRIDHHAAVLADLHNRLAAVPAPTWLPAPRTGHDYGHGDGDGDGHDTAAISPRASLLHLDLHPFNVILTPERGPVVIDWTNAAAGDPAFELARTLVTLTAAAAPNALTRAARHLYLKALRRHAHADPAPRIADAARGKLADPNNTPAETARIHALIRRAETRPA